MMLVGIWARRNSALVALAVALVLLCASSRQAAAHCAQLLEGQPKPVTIEGEFWVIYFRNTCDRMIHVQVTVTFDQITRAIAKFW